jgi:predicted HicB family RNase H-like nuclease
MTNRGYTALIEYNTEDNCLIGHIAGIDDIVGCHDDSEVDPRATFEEVDDYLEIFERLGRVAVQSYCARPKLGKGSFRD